MFAGMWMDETGSWHVSNDNSGDDYGHDRYHEYYDRNGTLRDGEGRTQSDPNFMGPNSSDPNYVAPNR
jgi:hypothetical protein